MTASRGRQELHGDSGSPEPTGRTDSDDTPGNATTADDATARTPDTTAPAGSGGQHAAGQHVTSAPSADQRPAGQHSAGQHSAGQHSAGQHSVDAPTSLVPADPEGAPAESASETTTDVPATPATGRPAADRDVADRPAADRPAADRDADGGLDAPTAVVPGLAAGVAAPQGPGAPVEAPTRAMAPTPAAPAGESAAERTDWIPVTPRASAGHPDGRPVAAGPGSGTGGASTTTATTPGAPGSGPGGPGGPTGPDGPPPPGGSGGDGSSTGGGGAGRSRRPLLIGAAVVALLAVLYVGDLLVSSTDVPRGVTVAGVEIGGMSKPEAEQALSSQVGPRLREPVVLQAEDATANLDPRSAGLELDLDGTIARAGEQPFNPITRVSSLFSTREVAPVTTANSYAVGRAVDGLRPQLDRPATEGTIRFEQARPVAVPSVPGRTVDGPAATQAVMERWLDPNPVVLPVTAAPVSVTPEGLQTAMDEVARPAVAGPVTVVGDRKNATVSTTAIGTVLRFAPDGSGGLTASVDQPAAERAVSSQLATTETEAKDATLDFVGTGTTVVPAVVGREIDYPKTFTDLLEVLGRPADQAAPPLFTPPPVPPGVTPASPPAATGRAVNAVYTTSQPKVTTEALNALGPAEVVGEFQTNGFATDSGQNIKRVAEQVNGATVAPGETFSLNDFTGPRDASQGYVEAGIIEDGVPGRGIGGGISQFATTLYNAYYFAGLDDVEHKEHSYWISRYPAGREATVFEGAIDLQFRNDGPTPVLIRTTWTPSSIKVQLYGQKRYDVTSQSGPRTNPVAPGTQDLGGNPRCKPSEGVAGFTITDTRTLRDVATGETKSEPRTVRYEPEPEITCNG